MATLAPPFQKPPDTAWFGHPRGLAVLSATQVWERFSFFGMNALLGLYMTRQLLQPGHVEQVLGFAGFRAFLEALFGSMTDLALAALIFGLYSGLFNIMPVLGGWLADRFIGQRRAVLAGLLLMTAGHLTMASEPLFLIALALLVSGGGLLVGNLYAQVGNLYGAGDTRRDRGYSVHLIALNTGAFAAPLVAGTLGERFGFHWGFTAAGIGMLIGVATYWLGRDQLPSDRSLATEVAGIRDPHARRRILAILIATLPYIVAIASAMQAYNIVIIWAETALDRSVLGFVAPVTWLITFDGLASIIGVALTIAVWRSLAASGREPGIMGKLAIGSMAVASAWGLMALTASAQASPLLPVLVFFLLLGLGYGWMLPSIYAFASSTAPIGTVTTMVSIAVMAFGLGNIGSGWLGRFYEPLGANGFFALLAGVGVAGALLAVVLHPLVRRLLKA
jgi:POT family proton-dependent oligopeptide transporter